MQRMKSQTHHSAKIGTPFGFPCNDFDVDLRFMLRRLDLHLMIEQLRGEST